ncbi:hypothetical protein BDZ97DRAFT_1824790, partial [Flammula alnicola]
YFMSVSRVLRGRDGGCGKKFSFIVAEHNHGRTTGKKKLPRSPRRKKLRELESRVCQHETKFRCEKRKCQWLLSRHTEPADELKTTKTEIKRRPRRRQEPSECKLSNSQLENPIAHSKGDASVHLLFSNTPQITEITQHRSILPKRELWLV